MCSPPTRERNTRSRARLSKPDTDTASFSEFFYLHPTFIHRQIIYIVIIFDNKDIGLIETAVFTLDLTCMLRQVMRVQTRNVCAWNVANYIDAHILRKIFTLIEPTFTSIVM